MRANINGKTWILILLLVLAGAVAQCQQDESGLDDQQFSEDEWATGNELLDGLLEEEKKPETSPKTEDAPSELLPDENGVEEETGFVEEETGFVEEETGFIDEEFGFVGEEFMEGENLVGEEFMEGEDLINTDMDTDMEGLSGQEFAEGEDLIAIAYGENITSKESSEIKAGNSLIDDSFSEQGDYTQVLDLEHWRNEYLPQTMDYVRLSAYYRTQYFFHDLPHNNRSVLNELTARIEFTPNLGDFEFKIIPEINVDDFNAARDFYVFDHLEDNGLHRSAVTFSEAYVKTQIGPVDVSLGKKIYAWGQAYGPNPTDNFNPYDLIDPIEGFNINNERKIGVWSLWSKIYIADILDWKLWETIEFPALELIFIPRFTRNRSPLPGFRWYIDSLAATEPLARQLELQYGLPPGTVTFSSEEEMPVNTFENSQWAAKFSTTIKGWDFSLSYYDGVSRFASQRLDSQSFPSLKIVSFYDNIRIVGADFVTVFGPLKVFFEGVHQWSKSRDGDDYFNIIFGSQRYWSPVFFEADKIEFVLQLYFSRIVTRKSDNDAVFAYPDEAGDRGSSLMLMYQLDQAWTLTSVFAMNLNKDYRWAGNYIEVELSYQVHGNLSLSLKTQFFNGLNEDIAYGVYKDNDNLFFIVDWVF